MRRTDLYVEGSGFEYPSGHRVHWQVSAFGREVLPE